MSQNIDNRVMFHLLWLHFEFTMDLRNLLTYIAVFVRQRLGNYMIAPLQV